MSTSNREKKSLVSLLLIFTLVYIYGFFFLIPIPTLTRGIIFSYSPIVLACLVALIISNTKSVKEIKAQQDSVSFRSPIVAYIILNVVSLSYLLIYKGITDQTVFTGFSNALCVIIYFVLYDAYSRLQINVWKIFNIVSVLAILIIGFQILLADKSNHMILNSYDLANLGYRDGYRVTFFDSLILIFIFNNFICFMNKFQWRRLLFSFVGLLFIIFISQTRSVLLIAFLGILATYILKTSEQAVTEKKVSFFSLATFIPFIVVSIFMIVAIFTQLYEPIKDGTYINDGSYFARLGEISYYWDAIKVNPLFGLGNFSVTPGSIFWQQVHGITGYFYTQDIGLLGDTARLGIFIVVIFLWIVGLILIRHKGRRLSYEFVGYFVFFLFALGNYSLFTNGTALGLLLFFVTYHKYLGEVN